VALTQSVLRFHAQNKNSLFLGTKLWAMSLTCVTVCYFNTQAKPHRHTMQSHAHQQNAELLKAGISNQLPKLTANRFALALSVAAVLAASAVSSQAQSATATISGVAAGSDFDYTLTLKNTGTQSLNEFWYGWTGAGNNLPSDPISAANSLGWDNDLDRNSIQWVDNYGTSLNPGQSATFTFVSTSPLSAMTQPPAGGSVAYVCGIDFSQGVPGDSTAPFTPTIVTAPEPSTIGLAAAGSLILAAGLEIGRARKKPRGW
jgi:hypothetical protein